jgi:hypothetical protein
MPNTILLKKSSTAAAQPTAGQLSAGELAINTADGKLFAKNAAGTVVNLPVTSISGQTIAPGQVDVDNIRLDVNTISSTNTNGNVIVSPNGTGKVLLGRTTADGTTNVVQVNSLTINGSDTAGNGVTPSFAAKGSTFFSSADGSVGIGGWIIPEDTFGSHPNAFGYTGLNEAVTQYTPLCLTAQYGAQLWLSTNGNVGIGTAAPIAKLNVIGTVAFGDAHGGIGTLSSICGGYSNSASGAYSHVGGGKYNTASGYQSVVGGGNGNSVSNQWGTISGGFSNQATTGCFVGGGSSNIANNNQYSVIGGGYSNTASGEYSTVGGGKSCGAGARKSTVGGGDYNSASGTYGFVGGGSHNTASDYAATVSGGSGNTASGMYATISGGIGNTASGYISTVAGGSNNTASGQYSSVLAGSGSNTNGKTNSHIIGTNITADADSTTYVQNLKVSGALRSAGEMLYLWSNFR